MLYTVRRLADARSVYQDDPRVEATDHREAAQLSQLAEPGARLVVEGAGALVRYHVDQLGRIREESRYAP